MMRVLLWTVGGMALLYVIVSVVFGLLSLSHDNSPQVARRRDGLCPVPGCGLPAGHWKAAQ